jgi:ABC-type uncharacterized transport system ATPase subunit|tara:strand:+ start:595 stop:834 length:240 start_codon:yes stop_codon:yes gene_type:complete
MKPVNNKSLTSFLFDQMEKLNRGTIVKEDALAQVQLAKQINSQMRYELERARVIMQLSAHNAIYKDGSNLREIESKNFD